MGDIKVYDLNEVSEIVKVSKKVLYRLIKEGKLPAAKFGKEWRVSEEGLQEYLKGNIN